MTGREQVFRMKQFQVAQGHAAMKVGTDGVLLGAWAGSEDPQSILDVGTGSGLIALMLAQRFERAEIHAIDLDTHAAEQALFNAAASPFGNRIQVWQASLQEWAAVVPYTYDLIVCNPPYFSRGWEVPDAKRRMARDAFFLPMDELFDGTEKMLSEDGSLALILPAEVHQLYAAHAEANDWWLRKQTNVCSREGKPVSRVLSSWSKKPGDCQTDLLLLETPEGTRHAAYHHLTEAFYL